MAKDPSKDMVVDYDEEEVIEELNSLEKPKVEEDEDNDDNRVGKTFYMRPFLKELFDSWESYNEFQNKVFGKEATAKDKHEAIMIVAMNNSDEIIEVLENMELEENR